jgi:neutral ceramidase
MFCVLVLAVSAWLVSAQQQYLVGIGKSDVTGPAADVNMMGYAVLEQTAKGIHTRQFARAYVFADAASQ